MKLSSLLFAVALFLSTSVHAESRPTYAVETFDLFGVKLGMSYLQATEAFTKALDIDLAQLEPIDSIVNPETGMKEPWAFEYQKDSYKVLVNLVTTISVDGNEKSRVVSAITYTADRHAPLRQLLDFNNPWGVHPDTWPLINDFMNKYGKPSETSLYQPRRGMYPIYFSWCSDFDLEFSSSGNKQKPHLTVNYYNPEVRLADKSYYTALRDYNTRVDIKRGLAHIEKSLRKYYKHKKRLPTQEQGILLLTIEIDTKRTRCEANGYKTLCSRHAYLAKVLSIDAYRNDYKYRLEGSEVTLISMGKNGEYDSCLLDDICTNIDFSVLGRITTYLTEVYSSFRD